MKKSFLFLFSGLLLWACQSPTPAHTHSLPVQFTILHLNDVYEIAPLEEGKLGGMARVASLEKKLHSQEPNTITVLAGDFLSPSVIGTVKINGERVQGEQMVGLMNQVGVDWVVFGNHEFDIKEAALQKRMDESEFQWLAGNVLHKVRGENVPFRKKDQPLPKYAIWDISNPYGQSLRVGLIGVCLDANKQDFVHYNEVFNSAEADYALIKDSVDFCIGLTHLSIEQDRELARRIPQLKLIMGGHEHDRHFERLGEVVIAKADANAKSAWVHRFRWDGKQLQLNSYLEELRENISLDPEANSLVEAWEEKAYAAFAETGLNLKAPICTLAEPLDGREASIRNQQNNFGKILAESMYAAAKDADCAIVNSGSIRIDDFLSGSITEFDLVRAMPFGGSVLKVDMKGALLLQILEAGEANRGNGGYLQRFNLTFDNGNWVIGQEKTPVQAESKYRVAISDFLLTGLESRLDFLTRDNQGIYAIIEPGNESLLKDIRLVLADFLKKQ